MVDNIAAKKRIRQLKDKLQQSGIDAALLFQARDIFYYANTSQPSALLIPADSPPTLFVRRALDFVRNETTISDIVDGGSLVLIKNRLYDYGIKKGTLGIEKDVISAGLYEKILESFTSFEFSDISSEILKQRMIKDEHEIELIEHACTIFEQEHRTVLEYLRPGVTELEISAEILRTVRRNGSDEVVFRRNLGTPFPLSGVLVSGANTDKISGLAMTVTGVGTGPALPWGSSDRKIEKGDMVIFDTGPNYSGYQADCARTYSVGKPNFELKEKFKLLSELYFYIIDGIRPGQITGDIFKRAGDMARKMRMDQFFQGHGNQRGTYIGHGVGLEIDEMPYIFLNDRETLVENMVFTIEPKFMIPGWGAVVLEDTMLLTDKGCRILTPVEQKLFVV